MPEQDVEYGSEKENAEGSTEPKNSSGQGIRLPKDLPELVQTRTVEFAQLYADISWNSLLQCPLESAEYTNKLPKETITLTEGMRHFILWSIYPASRSVNEFVTTLDPAVSLFFDSLQKCLNEGSNSLKALKFGMQPAKLSAVANKLPPNFETVIYKLWDNLSILASKGNWSELDFEKNLYSVIDSLMLRKFRTTSNRQSADKSSNLRPDFQVSQVLDEEEYILLLGEDEENDHSPIGHKDSYKLFELSRYNLHGFSKKKFDEITTFGILNGGVKFTLFEFTREVLKKNRKKYTACWIRGEDDVTFTFCFEEFSKILKVLLALYNALVRTETRIQYLIDNPEQRSKEVTTSTFFSPEKPDTKAVKRSSLAMERKREKWTNTAHKQIREDSDEDFDDDSEEQQEIDSDDDSESEEEENEDDEDEDMYEVENNVNRRRNDSDDEDDGPTRGETSKRGVVGRSKERDAQSSYQRITKANTNQKPSQQRGSRNKSHVTDTNFKFNELFPVGSSLLGYNVEYDKFAPRNINCLGFYVAKWCYANNRSVPYEVEIISKFPLWTIPQPIKWASVDDGKYHVIVYPGHWNCPITALQDFRKHAFDFIRTLQYIHEKGYVHGDIKFENSMCDMDWNTFHLIDFDHSCQISQVSSHKFGTRGHRAPEYLLNGEYTIAAEMFSFGVWLIEWFFQRSVPTILTKFRPDFSVDTDEPNAVPLLLEVFEEYADSKPYSELWPSHFNSIARLQVSSPVLEYDIDETQFQHLRVMIRELLNVDPAKRPSCKDLLTDPKYCIFLDKSDSRTLVIPKSERTKVTKHVIYSPKYDEQRVKSNKENNAITKAKKPVPKQQRALRDVTNTLLI